MKRTFLSLILGSITGATFAAADTSSFEKQPIFVKDAPASNLPLSAAIKSGDTVYISGQIPFDPKTRKLISGNFDAQFKQVLSNLSDVTQAAGGDLNSLVKINIFVTDLAHYDSINTIMSENFKAPFPARSVIGVKELPFGATVEIEGIMILPAIP